MNMLRAGSLLRIPAPADMESIADTKTSSEVKQLSASKPIKETVAASTKPANERLRLVPAQQSNVVSTDQVTKPFQTATASSAAVGSVNERIKALEAELAEAKRLIDVKSAELAQIQQQLSAAPQAVTTSASSLSAEAVSSEASSEMSASSAAVEPSAKVQTSAEAANVAKTDNQTPIEKWLAVVAQNSLTIIASALGVIVALLLWIRWRQRRSESQEFDDFSKEKDFPEFSEDRSSESRQTAVNDHLERTADRSDQYSQTLPPGSSLEDTTTTRPILSDITLSGETALHVKQHDVLAEAEFHLAYGLYDQAAEIIKRAMERQPERHELKLKLAEIYFTSSNKEAFIDIARKLRDELAGAQQGDWDKVLTMGRQLCPQDPLFANGSSVSATSKSVDVALDDGEQGLDMDLYDVSESSGLSPVLAQDADKTAGDATNHSDDLDFAIDELPQTNDEDTSSTRRTGTFNFSPPPATKGEDLFASHNDEPTKKTAKLSLDEMDFNLDDLDSGVLSSKLSTLTDQTDQVIDDRTVDVTRPQKVLDQALQSEDAESALMNEVGTKLDLARAYMDMGDPDGARSILQEVLQEGSAGQKLEAERLLSSIG
jgi:pilus assembly protein FimV